MIGVLVSLIIYLLVVGILMWLVYFVIDAIPIPDPPARFIKIAIVVLAVLVVVLMLLNFTGIHTGIDMPKM